MQWNPKANIIHIKVYFNMNNVFLHLCDRAAEIFAAVYLDFERHWSGSCGSCNYVITDPQ